MRAIIIMAVKGVLILVLCTVLCTLGWEELVKDRLYHCMQSQPMDFLRPGDWVHGTIAGGTGNYGDWIRPGWGIAGIWAVWAGCAVVSAAISVILAIIPWRRSRRYYR
jgi:hypothetical protein